VLEAALDMGVIVELALTVEVELGVGVEVGVSVDEGVRVGVEMGVGVLVGVSVEVLVLVGVGVGVEVLVLVGVAELVETEMVSDSVLPLPSFSKTTMWAVSPLGTVTTQPVAPPAPVKGLPIISLTELTAGSILQGRPLQPSPSHSISIPKSGLTLRKGVVGSR
jgi:hypothetical protein